MLSQSKLNKLLGQFAASRWWSNRACGRWNRRRVDLQSHAHFSSAGARVLCWCIAHEAWLTDWRASGTDRRLYIVDKPRLVMTQWTDSGENGKCSRLETLSAPLQPDSATASFLLFLLFFSRQDPGVGGLFLNCTSRRDGVGQTGRKRTIIRLKKNIKYSALVRV